MTLRAGAGAILIWESKDREKEAFAGVGMVGESQLVLVQEGPAAAGAKNAGAKNAGAKNAGAKNAGGGLCHALCGGKAAVLS